MARGVESKAVEFRQSEDKWPKVAKWTLTGLEHETEPRRRTLELALGRAGSELGLARSAAHRQMLEQAIAALRERIGQT